MKIVVIGGTGLIGSRLVTGLTGLGHDAVAAAPNTGVNTLTGAGLSEAMEGAAVVVDVSNSPSFEDAAVLEFFETSKLIGSSAIPFSIVHATQFFEFVRSMTDAATDGGTARFAPVLFQPMAGDEVAQAVGRTAVGAPLNATIEVAGPGQFRMDEFFRDVLAARGDPRTVITDPHASYFGAELSERTLLPGADAVLGGTRYSDWPGRTPQEKK